MTDYQLVATFQASEQELEEITDALRALLPAFSCISLEPESDEGLPPLEVEQDWEEPWRVR